MSLLSPFDRVTCGRLVRRLLNSPNAARTYERFGPVGMARLCSAYAFAAYSLPVSIATAFFARAAMADIALPLLIVLCVLFTLLLRRGLTGYRAVHCWRTGKSNQN